MEQLTRHPKVYEEVGRVATTRGEVTVLLTENPTTMQPSFFNTYVALAGWRPPTSPVVMFVTAIFVGTDKREVNLVYAPPSARHDERIEGSSDSVPVQIGRWLFDNSYLTHHSADRTPSGDLWAHQVGGILPELAQEDDPRRGTAEATRRSSTRAYDALCATDWNGWFPSSR